MAKNGIKKLPGLDPVHYIEIIKPATLKAWLSNKTAARLFDEVVWNEKSEIDDDDFMYLEGLPKNLKHYDKIDPISLARVVKRYVDVVLGNWKEASDDTTARELVASAPLFVEMSKVIPHVNPSEEYKYAFRGTELSENQLKSYLRAHPNKNDWRKVRIDGGGIYYSYVGKNKNKFTYKPHRDAQSWSVSDKAASNFGYQMIATPIDRSFFFDPGFMNSYGFSWEDETVHIGKEPMKVALLINDRDFTYYSNSDYSKRDPLIKETNNLSESIEVQDEDGTLTIPL